jgi:hypothetical protein
MVLIPSAREAVNPPQPVNGSKVTTIITDPPFKAQLNVIVDDLAGQSHFFLAASPEE